MSTEFMTTGKVENGALQVRNQRALKAWTSKLKDCEVTVTIARVHATRNLEQNALYHVGYVKPLSEHSGYTPNEMHAYLKARFLPTEKRRMNTLLLHNAQGEVIDEYVVDLSTTTTLNKIEFGEYLDAICVFAASLGVVVGSHRDEAAGEPQDRGESRGSS